jgi:hypothetical protein
LGSNSFLTSISVGWSHRFGISIRISSLRYAYSARGTFGFAHRKVISRSPD